MRNLPRRLVRLEARASALTAEAAREPHILQFVNTDMKVVSQFDMGSGIWTHFEERPAIRARQARCGNESL